MPSLSEKSIDIPQKKPAVKGTAKAISSRKSELNKSEKAALNKELKADYPVKERYSIIADALLLYKCVFARMLQTPDFCPSIARAYAAHKNNPDYKGKT